MSADVLEDTLKVWVQKKEPRGQAATVVCVGQGGSRARCIGHCHPHPFLHLSSIMEMVHRQLFHRLGITSCPCVEETHPIFPQQKVAQRATGLWSTKITAGAGDPSRQYW